MAKGITRISVKGFKSLAEECSIEIRPLTILAGANSSGKSSIMQPLLMMKQTLEASYDPGALLIAGPNVLFTSTQQFLSKSNGKVSDSLRIEFDLDSSFSLTETFKREPKKFLDITEMTYIEGERATTLRPGMGHRDLLSAVPWLVDVWNNFIKKQGKKIEDDIELRTYRIRCFLDIGYFPIKKADDTTNAPPILVRYMSDTFGAPLRGILHISALRGNPQRTYKITAVTTQFPGKFEDYVASIVYHWQISKDACFEELGKNLEILGLTRKVVAIAVDDTQVELLVGRLPASSINSEKDMVSIADVGFGVSQVLPIIVAILTAKPSQLVYIEQPEIHLHPKAQIAMAQILADAANRGVKVVVETHSSLLLLGIQSLVAEGKLAPDIIKLHWFKRRPDDGVTEVSSADLDEAGAFGDWPEDFADVELSEQSRYMDAAELRLRNK
ncbi:MAG: AAA family ATPase [Methanothrix sp.]|jgi:predicted ATPase|nr:AAA family ATPase [Methanothrix sp.]